MKDIITIFVKILHLFLFIFLIAGPFSNNSKTLKYHYDLVIFIFIKWFILDKCTFIKLETKLRQLDNKQDGIVYQFLEPIVQLKEHPYRILIMTLTALLGYISLKQLKT